MPVPAPGPVTCAPAPRARRSVFGNYLPPSADVSEPKAPPSPLDAPITPPPDGDADRAAFSRAFVLQFLARAFDYPGPETWAWLCAPDVQQGLQAAVEALEPNPTAPLATARRTLPDVFLPGVFTAFHDDYIAAIGHAARGSCPANEIEYGDLKADPLFQPHRLADLAAFYRAFGVELTGSAGERHDHLSVELEFVSVLAAQEASLLNGAPAHEALRVCRDAQRKFLREHLARWTPAFARRLQRAVGKGPLARLAAFLLAFVESECHRTGIPPGSEDLLLRPADEAASLCDGCGLKPPVPGATAD
ncbi:MAG: molecular chaperone TorD family protein [Verrucomicrobiales bacterium]|nr:molecular chaperone TorD family protein [Verrucomicrobiales bacterium]